MRIAGENVMNTENLVVNNAFHEIKQAPSRQHGAKENPATPLRAGVTRGTK